MKGRARAGAVEPPQNPYHQKMQPIPPPTPLGPSPGGGPPLVSTTRLLRPVVKMSVISNGVKPETHKTGMKVNVNNSTNNNAPTGSGMKGKKSHHRHHHHHHSGRKKGGSHGNSSNASGSAPQGLTTRSPGGGITQQLQTATFFEPLVELRSVSNHVKLDKPYTETYKQLQAQLARSHRKSMKLNLIRNDVRMSTTLIPNLFEQAQVVGTEMKITDTLLHRYTDHGSFSKVVAMAVAASVLDSRAPLEQQPMDGKKREVFAKFKHDVTTILAIPETRTIDRDDYRSLWHLFSIFSNAMDQKICSDPQRCASSARTDVKAHSAPDSPHNVPSTSGNQPKSIMNIHQGLDKPMSDADLLQTIRKHNPQLHKALKDPLEKFLVVYGRFVQRGNPGKFNLLRGNNLNDFVLRYVERLSENVKPLTPLQQRNMINVKNFVDDSNKVGTSKVQRNSSKNKILSNNNANVNIPNVKAGNLSPTARKKNSSYLDKVRAIKDSAVADQMADEHEEETAEGYHSTFDKSSKGTTSPASRQSSTETIYGEPEPENLATEEVPTNQAPAPKKGKKKSGERGNSPKKKGPSWVQAYHRCERETLCQMIKVNNERGQASDFPLGDLNNNSVFVQESVLTDQQLELVLEGDGLRKMWDDILRENKPSVVTLLQEIYQIDSRNSVEEKTSFLDQIEEKNQERKNIEGDKDPFERTSPPGEAHQEEKLEEGPQIKKVRRKKSNQKTHQKMKEAFRYSDWKEKELLKVKEAFRYAEWKGFIDTSELSPSDRSTLPALLGQLYGKRPRGSKAQLKNGRASKTLVLKKGKSKKGLAIKKGSGGNLNKKPSAVLHNNNSNKKLKKKMSKQELDSALREPRQARPPSSREDILRMDSRLNSATAEAYTLYRGIIPKPKGDAAGLSKTRTICLDGCRYDVVRRTALAVGFKEVGEHDLWNIIWTDVPITIEKALEMRRFQNAHAIFWGTTPPVQKANHFPGMNEICRKDRLARNLNRMKKCFPDDYNFFPRTWSLPADVADLLMYSRVKKNATYICKPDSGCQGKGIFLARNIKKLNPFAKLICQVYIPKPLLIDGYKFDLRMYILLTSCDPLRVFIYDEGIARFATVKYSPPNDTNIDVVYMHLTNYSLNKFSQSYDPHNDGSKRKMSAVLQTLEDYDYDVKKLKDAIDALVVKTVIAAQPTLKHYYRASFPRQERGSACFEILGFDILIDRNLRPFLLEVNHSPSFNLDLPVDAEIKESLLMDTFNIIYLGGNPAGERTKKSLNLNGAAVEKASKGMYQQVQHEQKHCGKYRLIYPTENSHLYNTFFDQTSCPTMVDSQVFTRRVRPNNPEASGSRSRLNNNNT